MKKLFDFYPEAIFSPLASPNKRLYFDVIFSLYSTFFDDSAEYLETTVEIPRIKSHIEQMLFDSELGTYFDEDNGVEVELKSIDDYKNKANAIYSKLKESGWLKIDKDGVRQRIYMSPRINGLVDFLSKSSRNFSDEIGGSVFSIYQVLLAVSSQKYSSSDVAGALNNAVSDSRRISRRMNNLGAELLDLHEKLGELLDLSEKTKMFFEDFIGNSSFTAYKDIKGANHPFRFKSEILKLLDNLEYNHSLRDKIIANLQEAGNSDSEKAHADLLDMLRIIRNVFYSTEPLLNRIDRNHGRLVKRINEAVKYQQRTPSSISERFTEALSLIKQSDNESDKFGVSSPVPKIYAYKDSNFTLPSIKKPAIQTQQTIANSGISSLRAMQIKLSRDYAQRLFITQDDFLGWLEQQFEQHNADNVSSINIEVNCIEDTIFFAQSRRLCKPSHEQKKQFNSVLDRYGFTLLSEDTVEHETVICRPFKLSKKAPAHV
jgi:hypothetical protein